MSEQMEDAAGPSKRALSGSPVASQPTLKKQAIDQSDQTADAPREAASSSSAVGESVINGDVSQPDVVATSTAKPKDFRGGKGRKGRERPPWNPPAGSGKRERTDGRDGFGGGAEGEGEGEEGGGDGEGKKRLPKKRVAVLLGYCGTGYQGMQIQVHGAKTIEGDFFDALCKAGAISADNATDHRKVDVQRSARTDAGVHAAGNVISLKMIYDPPLPDGVSDLTEYVNSFLPDQIRMWGFVRTMKSFQARTACDSRVYEYLLPSYCLLPPSSRDPICVRLNESSPGWRDVLGSAAAFADETPDLKDAPGEEDELDPRQRGEYERRRGWRVDAATIERFRALVKQFEGTHNFHNYTVGKPFNDKTVKRYMISLDVRDPKVYGDIEWVSVRIHGQSFMLHQIRKMMSLAMLACRTASPPSLVPETFGPKRIHIPKAPPLGLLLQQPQFKTYNDRIQHQVGPGGGVEDRDPVDFERYQDIMEAFKVKWIYERLRKDELETHVFHKWIRQVDCSSSPAFSFLNKQGVIGPEATMQGKRPAHSQDGSKAKAVPDAGEVDSEEEEVDTAALKRGELEG